MDARKKIERYIREIEWDKISCGKRLLDGKDYVNICEILTRQEENTVVYEKHDKYIDGFYVISGEERVFLSRKCKETVSDYSEREDIGFYYCELQESVHLRPGDLLVVDTDTYHRPSLCTALPAKLKVAVFKIFKNKKREESGFVNQNSFQTYH